MRYQAISRGGRLFIVAGFLAVLVSAVVHQKASATIPYVNTMVDTTSSGNEVTDCGWAGGTNLGASSDGRYVLFDSESSQYVSGDSGCTPDLFVKDTQTGAVTMVDLTTSGLWAPQVQTQAAISANGRYVAFIVYNQNNRFPGNSNMNNVYVRDLQNHTTTLVSQSTAGVAANADSWDGSAPAISADGRYITFESYATNLVNGGTNSYGNIFLRDTKLGTTTILSNTDTGASSNSYSGYPAISCDGAYVAFESDATNLVTGDPNTHHSIYLVDRANGNSIKDITPNANGSADTPSQLSCDGTTLMFGSNASNLVANDTNNLDDLFTYKLGDGTIQMVNVSSSGQQALTYGPSPYFGISFNGRYVTFATNDPNMVSGDTNGYRDIFIRDTQTGVTQRIDVHSDGTQTTAQSDYPFITQDGREVIYESDDTGLVANDTNNRTDVFMSETGY